MVVACTICHGENFTGNLRSSVKCSTSGCDNWTHAKCLGLKRKELIPFSKVFVCEKCKHEPKVSITSNRVNITSHPEALQANFSTETDDMASGTDPGPNLLELTDSEKLNYLIKQSLTQTSALNSQTTTLQTIQTEIGVLTTSIGTLHTAVSTNEAAIHRCQEDN